MKKLIFIYIYLCPVFLFSQKEDFNWSFGMGVSFDSVTNILNFNSQPPLITNYDYWETKVSFSRNIACISDSVGDFLFASNGMCVINKALDTMQNGAGLNLNGSSVTDLNPKSSIILPSPNNSREYYLIYHFFGTTNGGLPTELRYAKIDMSLNGGLGKVVQKHIPILSSNIAAWSLNAVRHANGRDWWILCPTDSSDAIHKILLSPSGFQNMGTQNVGIISLHFGANLCIFSPDGTKYFQYLGDNGFIRIHNFDRCIGELKGYIDIPTISYAGGLSSLAISGNSNYLYISNGDTLLQYNLTATNIETSKIIVGVSDHFSNNLGMQIFDQMQLAPDGKIYMASGFFDYLHVINNPDSGGLACNFVQRQIQLPVSSMGLPNLPNFRLGREIGSVCDTVYTSIIKEEGIRKEVRVYPNPASGRLHLSASEDVRRNITFYNLLGEKKKSLYLAGKSAEIEVSDLAEGLYLLTIEGEKGVIFSQKIIIER